jgi:hypothetical protein
MHRFRDPGFVQYIYNPKDMRYQATTMIESTKDSLFEPPARKRRRNNDFSNISSKPYHKLSPFDLQHLSKEVKKLHPFVQQSARSFVCDYILVQKTLRRRNPFRNVRHYVKGASLESDNPDVDIVFLHLVTEIYKDSK